MQLHVTFARVGLLFYGFLHLVFILEKLFADSHRCPRYQVEVSVAIADNESRMEEKIFTKYRFAILVMSKSVMIKGAR